MITKDSFLSPSKIEGPFDIPKLGDIYVREIPYDHTLKIFQAEDCDRFLRIVIASVCNESREPVFCSADIMSLREMGITKIDPLVSVVMKYSGAEAEDVEDALGNLEATTTSDSGTG